MLSREVRILCKNWSVRPCSCLMDTSICSCTSGCFRACSVDTSYGSSLKTQQTWTIIHDSWPLGVSGLAVLKHYTVYCSSLKTHHNLPVLWRLGCVWAMWPLRGSSHYNVSGVCGIQMGSHFTSCGLYLQRMKQVVLMLCLKTNTTPQTSTG